MIVVIIIITIMIIIITKMIIIITKMIIIIIIIMIMIINNNDEYSYLAFSFEATLSSSFVYTMKKKHTCYMVEKLPRSCNIKVAHEAMLVPALMILYVISRYYSSLFLRKKY